MRSVRTLDRPGSPRIAPDRPGSPRIAPDRPGSPWIAPDRPGSPRIAPDRPGSPRIALDRPRLAHPIGCVHIPHLCPGGVLPTMRQGLYCMAWSSNPMEVSPLDLRSLTVLPRALLEVSADPPVRRRQQQQQPSVHQQPPADIAPRVVR